MVTTTIGSRGNKAVCSKCRRTVHVVVIAGLRVFCDAELITVIPFEGEPVKIRARRSHAETCLLNVSRDSKLASLAKAKP